MIDAEELLTIAEAAPRLGVTERRLRRLLGRGDYAARCRPVTRRTRSGRRQALIAPDPRLVPGHHLPAKVLIFILADGWHVLAGSLAASYHT